MVLKNIEAFSLTESIDGYKWLVFQGLLVKWFVVFDAGGGVF